MMKTILFKSNAFLVVLFFVFASQSAFAQLTDFTLQVAATNETCTGNGTLTFSTQNPTPGATLLYSVFLLPDVATPVAVLSGTTLTGLSAGNYRVVALQSLGNESNSQTVDVAIQNAIVPLTFSLTGTAESCGNGSITVTAVGNVAFYEIISGPQTYPAQTSNVFANLSEGTYNVRVTDTCGDAYVQTFTVLGSTYLFVSDFEMGCQVIDCDTTVATFVVHTDLVGLPDTEIVYPLLVTATVFPPGGGTPIVVTQTITSGDSHSINVTSQIPFFNGEEYTCDIAVTDSCGNTFASSGNEIAETFTASVEATPGRLSINTCLGLPPYTVTFTSAPDGFNPSDFNANHPGPFSSTPIEYLSSPEHQLPEGEYEVIITDSCGNVAGGGSSVVVCPTSYVFYPACPNMGQFLSPDGSGAYLATGFITEAPAGFGETLPFDLAPFINEIGLLSITLPPGHYVIEGMSLCPRPYSFNFTIPEPHIDSEGTNAYGCATDTGEIKATLIDGFWLVNVMVTEAPAGFGHPLPYDASEFISSTAEEVFEMPGLMYGDYVLTVTDYCGNVYTVNVNVPLRVFQGDPRSNVLPGCAIGYGAISMATNNGAFEQIIILEAPATYPFVLPHDVSFAISSSSNLFFLSNLPEGSYTFYTKDTCGLERTITPTVLGFHILANDIRILGNCGSFDINMAYSPDNLNSQNFWLQKYDSANNVWEHPITGVDYNGLPSALNSYSLTNNSVNYNIAVMGHFRVLRENRVYTTGSPGWTHCQEVIKEFDFNGQLRIDSAYSIPCSNGVSQVIIIAGDTFPLTYRITEKDGMPFLVENGNSNSFAGLIPGIYNFQVEDNCGNIANRLFDIISLAEPVITAHSLCDGQNGYLSVQGISYLSYQWWNNANPTNILSTNSTLYFSPFSQSTTPGTYSVRVYSTTALSCIDTTISYTISPISSPNAGEDANIVLCGTNSAIDLFTLLGGTFDTTGYWQETTGSGMLSGHSWLPVGLPIGTYVFRYHVDGFCVDFDEAVVSIQLKGVAPVPVVSVDQDNCTGGEIRLSANTIAGAAYHWTGPDNFSSNEQNPTIANSTTGSSGTYALTITVNECNATSNVIVEVNSSPNFDLSQHCENGSYVIKALPVNDAFNPGNVIYDWTGPQGYSSTVNPINITGLSAGDYRLTITTDEGCTISKSVTVSNTRCSIPTGISPNDDGNNDSLDLTGYDVLRFKIFSRYGNIVFEQDDYTDQWHGQDYNNRPLPDATYYYYIKFKTGEEKTGWVYVTK